MISVGANSIGNYVLFATKWRIINDLDSFSMLTKQYIWLLFHYVHSTLFLFFTFFSTFQHNAYLLENTEDSHIEMYDMVTDPRFLRGSGANTQNGDQNVPSSIHLVPREKSRQNAARETTRNSSARQPDLRQVVGLRNTLTCCVMQRPHYGKL